MRKIIAVEWISLDGYISDSEGKTDWLFWNKDVESHYIKMQENIDLLLFGRKTFQIMEAYWPTPDAHSEDPFLVHHMNKVQKVVYSESLQQTDWNNSTIRRKLDFTEINHLKKLPGKDIVIYGSNTIMVQLAKAELIDEFRLMISPVILGGGTIFFGDFNQKLSLKLLNSIKFDSGFLLYYSI